VRGDRLARTTAGQVFPFPPTAARWVLLRFWPAGQALRVAVAETALLGRTGPPASRYAFKESPARAIDVLARLKKLTALTISVSKDEADLFADAKGGKLERWTFAEAALLASGVADAGRRKKYQEQLAGLEAAARKAVADGKAPWERGEKLLRFLHGEALARGYVSKQTDLPVVLDERTFNCVSSALLFNVLARRLGLDARAVEVPDHAFSIVYDGTRPADVETTTAHGFNPARDPETVKELQRRTGFVYIPDSHRDRRREVRDVGLVAIVYYNHAVGFAHQRRWHEALGQFFRALSLDQEFPSAVKNTLTVLALWSWELAHGGKYEQAVEVLAAGLDLAPRDARLLHNRQAVWTHWALALLGQGKEADALAVLRRAVAAVPDGPFAAMQAWVFIRKAEEQARAGKWQAALAAADSGKAELDGPAAAELRTYRTGLRLRWAHAEIAARRFEQALDALAGGLSADPGDRRLPAHLAFAVQEYVVDTHAREGEARSREVLAAQVKRFRAVPAVQGVAARYVWAIVKGMLSAGEYEKAIAFIDRCGDLLPDPKVARYLVLAVYDAWADRLAEKKDDAGAVQVYQRAQQRYPRDAEVVRRGAARLDAWARSRSEEGAWDDALALYEKYRRDLLTEEQAKERLLYLAILWTKQTYQKEGAAKADELSARLRKRYPSIPDLRQRARRASLQKLVRELGKAGKYEQALAILDRAGEMLDDKGEARRLTFVLLRELSAGLAARPDRDRAREMLNLEGALRQALTDPDGAVRAAAADILANLEIHTAVADLVNRVADDRWVRSEYRNKRLNDPVAGGKAAALAALRKLAPEQVTPALLGAVQSKTPAVAVWACGELGGQKDAAALEGLVRALTDSNGYVRRAAADGLKKRGDRAAAPALVKRIADEVWIPRPGGFLVYSDEPYDGFKGLGSKDHALGALRALAPDQVTPALLAALQTKDNRIRAWAAGEMGKQKGPEAVKGLMKALTDGDGYVRRAAADGLKALGDKAAAPALVKRVADEVWVSLPGTVITYRDEPYDGFRGLGSKDHALGALRALAPDQVTPALLAALQAKHHRVRAWSAGELGKQKGQDVVKALIKALADTDGYVRRAAADSLKMLGDKAAVPALVKRVADEVWLSRPTGFFTYRDEPYDGFRGLGSKDHALEALKALAPEQVKAALQEAARSSKAEVKKWAEGELKKREESSTSGGRQDREDVKSTPPPKSAIVLFDGKGLDGWAHRDGKRSAHWKVMPGGVLQVERGGDIMTRKTFAGRFKLHVEFRVPYLPRRKGQKRGNSGVYLQGRYEVQILDSYGLKSKDDDCGAIFGVAAPSVNACKAPEVWQSYDIEFTAPRCKDGKKVEPARMTVYHNGHKIHDSVPIPRDRTQRGLVGDPCTPGPILLQEHDGDPVQFRNIWLLPLPAGAVDHDK
jgi:HEAT repeat protein